MTAFLARLRDEPPPFRDASEMERWLEPYAALRINAEDDCRSELSAMVTSGPSGIAVIGATTDACDPPSEVRHLLLISSEHDMFVHERLIAAARAALGPPDAACSNETFDIWPLSDEMVVMVRGNFTAEMNIVAHSMMIIMNMQPEPCDVPQDQDGT